MDIAEAPQNRAFRFEIGYRPYVPPSTPRLDRYVAEAQSEDESVRQPALVASLQTLRRELTSDPHSPRILYSAQILSVLAWRPGNDLWNIVELSKRLIEPDMPTAVREVASEAVKNAAWHPGDHVEDAIGLVLEDHTEISPKMRYNFVKVLGAASRHSKDELRINGKAKTFLEDSTRDENPVISRRAKRVLKNIYG